MRTTTMGCDNCEKSFQAPADDEDYTGALPVTGPSGVGWSHWSVNVMLEPRRLRPSLGPFNPEDPTAMGRQAFLEAGLEAMHPGEFPEVGQSTPDLCPECTKQLAELLSTAMPRLAKKLRDDTHANIGHAMMRRRRRGHLAVVG